MMRLKAGAFLRHRGGTWHVSQSSIYLPLPFRSVEGMSGGPQASCHGGVVQKVPLLVTASPQPPALRRPGSISLDHQEAGMAWCLGPDMPKGQYSAVSPKQLVLKRRCCFVKMPGSGWSQDVDLFIQINSLAGKQDNSLSGRCCRH